jgi:uncharacterized protein YegL
MAIDLAPVAPRPLPVLLLVDCSASMGVDGKLEVLNDSVRSLVAALAALVIPGASTQVAVIRFAGAEAELHHPLTPASELVWRDLAAAGKTPLGAALRLSHMLLADGTVVPPRSFRPNLVLVTDGIPTDDWVPALHALDSSDAADRAFRFAVGIGSDAKQHVLEQFAGSEGQVLSAASIDDLPEFFRYVTFSVTRGATQGVGSQSEIPTLVEYKSADPTNIEF